MSDILGAVGRRAVLGGALGLLSSPSWALTDDFSAFAVAQMDAAAVPGMAVGLAQDGQVRMTRGFGLANIASGRKVTDQSMFHIASITKTVTAAAIMRLAAAARLDLDAPVAPLLDFPLANPNHPEMPITARHLLTHTSSISDARYYEIDFRERGHGDARLSLDDLLKGYLAPTGANYSADGCFSEQAPGEAWDYSNVGYALLGYLAGRIGGRDMREQTRAKIFAPLGMTRTSWMLAGVPDTLSVTPYDRTDSGLAAVGPMALPDWPAGNLRASIVDLTRFVGVMANGGASAGRRILPAASVAQMLDMGRPGALPDWLTGQGLGWMESKLDGTPRPNHWGGDPGVFTAAYLDPARRRAVVVLTNATASENSKAAVRAVAARLLA